MSEDTIMLLLFLCINALLIFMQYWIGRIVLAIYERDWTRTEDMIFYWVIGMITMNVIVWPIVGIIKLLEY